eukprot:1958338-Rhodomonas_salina.1
MGRAAGDDAGALAWPAGWTVPASRTSCAEGPWNAAESGEKAEQIVSMAIGNGGFLAAGTEADLRCCASTLPPRRALASGSRRVGCDATVMQTEHVSGDWSDVGRVCRDEMRQEG